MRTKSLSRGLLVIDLTLTALLFACGDSGANKLKTVETCKGVVLTVDEMRRQLRVAQYDGPLDESHVGEQLVAYNNAACGGRVVTCTGENTYWSIIDTRLRDARARYDGPLDHSRIEMDAYNRYTCGPELK